MNDLERTIQEAAQKYYLDGTSPYSDEEFDSMIDQLRIENPNSILFKVGWGFDLSSDSVPGTKREHIYNLIGSLDKCHDLKELGKDLIHVELDASTKLDGLSIVLYYENSVLQYALTRGDGYVGIDVTDKVLAINPRFAKSLVPFTGAIRGEVLMSYSKFEEFKKVHPEAKNPRNSTAGLINGKDVFDDLKYLDIILYTIVHSATYLENFETSIDATRSILREMFDIPYSVVPSRTILINSSSTDEEFITQMNFLREYLYQDYPADGIVLSKKRINCYNGTYVYNAKAFKFPAESKITTIIDIEWNMSKTKNCVPRVLLEPVQLSGTTVQACAGYHAQYIKENNLGAGSVIEVTKAGEIIPQIIKIHKSTTAKLPETCPECGEPLSWNGVHLCCTNDNCVNSKEQDVLVWLQNLVPVDGLGDILKLKFLRQLVDNGNMKDVSVESLMECKLHLQEDTKSAQFNTFAKMWNNLHDTEVTFDLVHALIACNIPRIGDLTAIKVANYPDAILERLDYVVDRSAKLQDLSKLIGDANAKSIERNIYKLARLNFIKDRIIWKSESTAEFKGKIAITGKLSVKRADFEKELRKHGYEPTNTVKKDTLFLITENPAGQSSKNKSADKYGVPKITEFDFRWKYLS